jgi:hypothetical protein
MIDDYVPYSYYREAAFSLHNRWILTLKDLKEVVEPSARQLLIDDLIDIYKQAQMLHDLHVLGPLHQPLVGHIIDRGVDEHAALARNSPVIPLF